MAGKESKGTGDPQDKLEARVLIIEARYYDDVGEELMTGAVAELEARGCSYEVISVPGALEIPQVLAQAVGKLVISSDLDHGLYDGAVALGCVIRGETAHYDIVCNNANHWLMETVINGDIPFGNAILTVDTKAQAMKRAEGGRKGKGGDAVRACLRMIEVSRKFDELGFKNFMEGIDIDDMDLEDVDFDDIDLDDIDLGEANLDKLFKGKRS